MQIEDLKSKKVAIVGLGTNNKKLAEFFSRAGVAFKVVEWQNQAELIGKLDNFDIIFRTPGLPYLSPAIQQAKNHGAEISSQTKLFFELCPAPIVGVTGTKGKGTTSSLIARILEAGGKKVWLAGNIGHDPFEFLDQIKNSNLVVLELSSFQLQDLDQSPHIAVVLNITSDHLNYHQSIDEYRQAKTSILVYQTERDFAILSAKLPDHFMNLGQAKKIFFDPEKYSGYKTKLLGKHNFENIAAAAEVAKLLGIGEQTIRDSVAAFETLPHHLQILKVVNGVTYIDDAISTNIEPTIAAVNAIKTPIILILGGHDKGLDFTSLGQTILEAGNIKGLVVIGEVTKKILATISGFRGRVLTRAKNMDEIIKQAQSIASPGDTILISPATDSFDMFKNMYDRAEQFVNAVSKL